MQRVECGLLAIMGSGETSPTMVSVHRAVVDQLPSDRPNAVLIETPYGFQENVADISARAQNYFHHSVGLRVSVAPGMRGRASAGTDADRGLAMVQTSDWIFSGPGSPSYALDHWHRQPFAAALAERIRHPRGAVVLASAAAATMGCLAVPVYEIYKVGAAPHWREGLNLLACLDLQVVVIPHYDNTEGGTHDTRYSYLGEHRLSILERELPADAAILGVDEHTAVIVDLLSGSVEITGRGGLTVRRVGRSRVLPAGATLSLAELRALTRSDRLVSTRVDGVPTQPSRVAQAATLPELTLQCERRFELARLAGAADDMVQAVLDLEETIDVWAADTEEDEGTSQARAVLRSLIVRLGHAAATGLRDPHDLLRPLVEPLLGLRERLRTEQAYQAADGIRAALTAVGVIINDTRSGTRWTVAAPVDVSAT
ncbi:cysteine--tRNA ligase [Micromonospora rubida]|uniref:hypothetical protein n=1 Tax=Micromonospora rubida TaxID=2697657 RepID=UPI001377CBC8|nr:hypothetical protein [Micromonospora rubida]NBE85300.1 hypothetical protein [Micromonospora rubida]